MGAWRSGKNRRGYYAEARNSPCRTLWLAMLLQADATTARILKGTVTRLF